MAAMTAVAKSLSVSIKWIILSVLSTAGNTMEVWSGVSLIIGDIIFPYSQQ